MCVIDFDEYCAVWHEHQRRARKAHKCSCCRRQIAPGEEYIVHFSIFDGSATSEKCCADCQADRDEFSKAHGGSMVNPGSFPMMVSDCVSEGDEEDSMWQPMLDRIWGSRKSSRAVVADN